MPFATDVNLPRNYSPQFPNRCVVCGDDPLGGTVTLWTHTLGWWTWVFFMFGSGVSVTAPACGTCAWRLRIQRWGRFLVMITLASVIVFFVWPHLDSFVPRPFRKWAGTALCLLCILPYFFWEVLAPPSFDITAFSDSIDYEFRNPEHAYEFADLNSEAQWVKIS